MRRRGFFFNSAVLILIIPLLLLVATYEDISSSIIRAQIANVNVEKQYFSLVTIQTDLKNAANLGLRRAYLALTEYVINNGFVNNASHSMKELLFYGTINGQFQPVMRNSTLEYWYSNLVKYFNSQGIKIIPNNSADLFANHLDIVVAPLDSFDILLKIRLVNITVEDSSGQVVYYGNIPQNTSIYVVMNVIGFEDPFIATMLGGRYTRVIHPCQIAYPGSVYGYYDVQDFDDCIDEEGYVGIDNAPSIFERFEGSMDNHAYYLTLSKRLQKELNFKLLLPVGLATFVVPSESPTLTSALQATPKSLLATQIENQTKSDYYFLRYWIYGTDFLYGYPVTNSTYSDLKLDNQTALEIFNTTSVLG